MFIKKKMNKNILNLNNRVGVWIIGAERAILVLAPLCIGVGKFPSESESESWGRSESGANCLPYLESKETMSFHPHQLSPIECPPLIHVSQCQRPLKA